MLSAQKIKEFGVDFIEDLQILTDILKNGKEQDAKIYIDSLKGKMRVFISKVLLSKSKAFLRFWYNKHYQC